MLINRKQLMKVSLPALLLVVMLVSAVAVLALPSLTKSSLAEMGYWVDWANLLAVAAGLGVTAAVLLWPVLAMRRGR